MDQRSGGQLTAERRALVFHQLRAPFRGGGEDRVERIAAVEAIAELRETLDETVKCVADRVGVRETDVAPHVRGARGEPRRVGETPPGQPQAIALCNSADCI